MSLGCRLFGKRWAYKFIAATAFFLHSPYIKTISVFSLLVYDTIFNRGMYNERYNAVYNVMNDDKDQH
jgi:hypothetical protein